MKIVIILNGISRKKKAFYNEILPALSSHFDIEVLETLYAGHAEELAEKAIDQQFDCLLVAGGDGTLNQVVNGVLKSVRLDKPSIGLIPLGSGNDFARTCSLRWDAEQLIQLLRANPTPTDIGMIECVDKGVATTRYFINECSLGMGPEVVKRLSKSSKRWGPDISYFASILSTFIHHRPQEIQCTTDSWEWKGKARVIAIANGRSFGNGIFIAPAADPGDGLFNSFIAGNLIIWKFLLFLQTLKGKKKINHPAIHYHTLSSAHLSAEAHCELEAEGEIVGSLPATIRILPKRINFFRS